MKKVLIVMTLPGALLSCSQKPQNGYELIEQMYNANKSNWYESINGFPVATVIKFYDNNGVLNMVEKYFDITPGCEVPSTIYDPAEFNNARW